MALLHQATIAPTKLELLEAWLPGRPWYQGPAGAALERVAACRFDDPAGEVGIETMLVRAGDGPIHHVPLTYRDAPLPGGEAWLVGTCEHSVLGTRWVYDAAGDPVYAAALTSAILAGTGQAEEFIEVDGEVTSREPAMTVSGSGSGGEPDVPAVHAVRRTVDEDPTLIVTDSVELALTRVLHGKPLPAGAALTASWPGLTAQVPLACVPQLTGGPVDRDIRTVEDVLRLMDGLFAPEADRWTQGGAAWWDAFYADRSRQVPFFVAKPDENLASYAARGLLTPGRALDLGCGPGRNAIHLASLGFEVDAVDLSPAAIDWGRDRAREASADVRFLCGDAFALADTELSGPYDLIYDSGCFHHLPPHRRVSYRALLDRCLAPGGFFGLSCFAPGGMGSELSDADLYREARLHGGVAYTPESLRWIFADLTEVELRRMHDEPPESPHFGEPFLWTALFRRDTPS